MKISTFYSIIILFSFFCVGVLHGLSPHNYYILHSFHLLSLSFMLFWWIGAYAAERNKYPSASIKYFCVFLMPLGMPYYFYRIYGFKLAVKKVFMFIGVLFFAATLEISAYELFCKL